MKLYGHPLSGNTHRVQALLGVLGIEYEYISVDMANGAHKAPEFLALNPLGQVPVFQDGDLILRDSSAILIYLARTYDTQNKWLPADPTGQARVQEWLSTAVNEIMSGPFMVRIIKLLGVPADEAVAIEKTKALFDTLFEPHLKDQAWLVGDTPSIADLACYSYIARVGEGNFSLEDYPAISAWLRRVEAINNVPPMVYAADVFAAAE